MSNLCGNYGNVARTTNKPCNNPVSNKTWCGRCVPSSEQFVGSTENFKAVLKTANVFDQAVTMFIERPDLASGYSFNQKLEGGWTKETMESSMNEFKEVAYCVNYAHEDGTVLKRIVDVQPAGDGGYFVSEATVTGTPVTSAFEVSTSERIVYPEVYAELEDACKEGMEVALSEAPTPRMFKCDGCDKSFPKESERQMMDSPASEPNALVQVLSLCATCQPEGRTAKDWDEWEKNEGKTSDKYLA